MSDYGVQWKLIAQLEASGYHVCNARIKTIAFSVESSSTSFKCMWKYMYLKVYMYLYIQVSNVHIVEVYSRPSWRKSSPYSRRNMRFNTETNQNFQQFLDSGTIRILRLGTTLTMFLWESVARKWTFLIETWVEEIKPIVMEK